MFQTRKISAPTIVGKKLLEAIAELSDHNLNVRIITQKEDPDLPQGTILSQTPKAGMSIKPNNSIYVVISKKPHKILCPMLINKKMNDIFQDLKEKNIRNKSYLLPSNCPISSCIAQFPSAGKMLKKNNVITYISFGNKKPVLVPNFKNKKLDDVLEFLNNYPIEAEVFNSARYIKKSTHDDFIVVNQKPLAGSIVNLDKNKPMLLQLKIEKIL